MAFFPEDLFSTLLLLERKRCERSGGRFALALLDVTRLEDPTPVFHALLGQMRETDIVGWYRADSTVGAIFTTLNGAAPQEIRDRLSEKIRKAIPDNVPFALYIFPEDISRELYPEVFISKPKASYHIMKRVVDISFSLTVLGLFSPVFIAVALAVKLTSPGPILFKQKRLGLLGKEFEFLKFRSMYTGNDPEIHRKYVESLIEGKQKGTGVFKIQNDPRVTRVGRFIRKSSLDEIPQFINVLRGEMSLVGPRPPIRYEMEKYCTWHKRRVLEVKPGITGLWQVHGRSRTTFEEMVRLDIRYINSQSAWLDTKILLQTPRAVLSASGAY
ncbi:MAG: sugar transferase [Acidobacteria bacterium]|nr:sugar transferase [Acidobacteriota bacterium]